ncbi:hypothetical protein F5Y09DRAFT_346176 [Xylaria sp. FL1042]|nr:hypothetical protein F5Y09DRAFT_346176 [Xylaria sp. FL1042]
MCDFEEFVFICNHSVTRLKSHCHFARNDPNHQCFSVKVLRSSYRVYNGQIMHVQQIEQMLAGQQMQQDQEMQKE